jgi:hypothetical protein
MRTWGGFFDFLIEFTRFEHKSSAKIDQLNWFLLCRKLVKLSNSIQRVFLCRFSKFSNLFLVVLTVMCSSQTGAVSRIKIPLVIQTLKFPRLSGIARCLMRGCDANNFHARMIFLSFLRPVDW